MVASNIVLNMGGLPLILTCLHGYSTRSVIKISLSQTVAFTLLLLGWVQRVQQIITLQLHTTVSVTALFFPNYSRTGFSTSYKDPGLGECLE